MNVSSIQRSTLRTSVRFAAQIRLKSSWDFSTNPPTPSSKMADFPEERERRMRKDRSQRHC